MSLVESFERGLLGALSPAGRRARLLILTFHRVVPERDPLLPEEPDARAFAEQMDVLRAYCRVLALPEAVKALKARALPPRAACITFDDGYANNLHVALPILEARGLTATFFIAVEAIRRGIMWNDVVIEAVRATQGEVRTAGLDLPVIDLAGVTRSAVVNRLLDKLKYLPIEQRWTVACELFRINADGVVPRLMLRESELGDIARRGHDVGAHTINHPILRELSSEDAQREIGESARWLADVTGIVPRSFAYPNGRPLRDYDALHVRMVREAGYELAVTTVWGCASFRSDIYQLPRCTPWSLGSRLFPLHLAKTYLLEQA